MTLAWQSIHIPVAISLAIIVAFLTTGVLASIAANRRKSRDLSPN
jgi:hypothetical protein